MRTAAKCRPMTDQPFIDGVQFGMHTMSRERVTQLARDLLEAMTRTKAVTLLKDREVVRQAIAHALADELKREEEREEAVSHGGPSETATSRRHYGNARATLSRRAAQLRRRRRGCGPNRRARFPGRG